MPLPQPGHALESSPVRLKYVSTLPPTARPHAGPWVFERRPTTADNVAITDKIYVKNHRQLASQLDTSFPKSAFSGATLDVLFTGDGIAKLDEAVAGEEDVQRRPGEGALRERRVQLGRQLAVVLHVYLVGDGHVVGCSRSALKNPRTRVRPGGRRKSRNVF